MAQTTTENTARRVPPFMNQLMTLILRSPLHGVMSKSIMLLTFTGHKSGKAYTLPVGYTRQGNTFMVFTDHNWWKNFRIDAPVTLQVQGKKLTGTARAPQIDKEEVARELSSFVQQLPNAARAYSVTLDSSGKPDPDSVRRAAGRFTPIHIILD